MGKGIEQFRGKANNFAKKSSQLKEIINRIELKIEWIKINTVQGSIYRAQAICDCVSQNNANSDTFSFNYKKGDHSPQNNLLSKQSLFNVQLLTLCISQMIYRRYLIFYSNILISKFLVMIDPFHLKLNPTKQITKSRLIESQLEFIAQCRDHLFTIKQLIALIFKYLNGNQQEHTKQEFYFLKKTLLTAKTKIQNLLTEVQESNQIFLSQFNLRDENKIQEHNFFKEILFNYENRIKGLKQYLLIIEGHVQQLEERGHLPFSDIVEINNILDGKSKVVTRWVKKEKIAQEMQGYAKGLSQKITQLIITELQVLKNQIFQRKRGKQDAKEEENERFCDEDLEDHLLEILKKRLAYEELTNWRIRQNKAKVLSFLEEINHVNKNLKEQCKLLQKIIKNRQNQDKIRNLQNDLTRDECLDHLMEMYAKLQTLTLTNQLPKILPQRRNNYRSKSLPSRNFIDSYDFVNDSLPKKIDNQTGDLQNHHNAFKDISNSLYDSFLDQCSQLITRQNIDDEREIKEIPL